jgi:hypothetical protein
MKLRIIILTLAIFTYAGICPEIQDGSSKMVSDFNCLLPDPKNKSILYAKECSGGKICSINENNIGYCLPYLIRQKFPGEYCDHNDECVNNICTVNHQCYGAPMNSECKENKDCNYDYACKIAKGETTGSCVRLNRIGECINGACDPPKICNNGTCVDFGSKNPGDPADNWMACKSFHLDGDVCAGEYSLTTNESDKNVCTYTHELNGQKKTFNEPPVCGDYSKPFCNGPRGNENITNVILGLNY